MKRKLITVDQKWDKILQKFQHLLFSVCKGKQPPDLTRIGAVTKLIADFYCFFWWFLSFNRKQKVIKHLINYMNTKDKTLPVGLIKMSSKKTLLLSLGRTVSSHLFTFLSPNMVNKPELYCHSLRMCKCESVFVCVRLRSGKHFSVSLRHTPNQTCLLHSPSVWTIATEELWSVSCRGESFTLQTDQPFLEKLALSY